MFVAGFSDVNCETRKQGMKGHWKRRSACIACEYMPQNFCIQEIKWTLFKMTFTIIATATRDLTPARFLFLKRVRISYFVRFTALQHHHSPYIHEALAWWLLTHFYFSCGMWVCVYGIISVVQDTYASRGIAETTVMLDIVAHEPWQCGAKYRWWK